MRIKNYQHAVKQAIIKVTSRCNLNCTYCYVYNRGDESWKLQPKQINFDTLSAAIKRCKTHCDEQQFQTFDIVLHGGEPLLLGHSKFDNYLNIIRTMWEGSPSRLRLSLQSNGLLLDNDWGQIFRRHDVQLGVSLDGKPGTFKEQRIDFQGRPTAARLDQILRQFLSSYQDVFSGFISVIDLQQDPIELFEYLASFHPEAIDFHLPLAHHDNPLPNYNSSQALYGKWLMKLFRHVMDKRSSISIRTLRGLVEAIVGKKYAQDTLGYRDLGAVVIETNGDYELVDNTKVIANGAAHTGKNVFQNSLEDFGEFRSKWFSSNELHTLSSRCLSCSLKNMCQGGFYVRRYSSENKFHNPDYFCGDLQHMIVEMHHFLANQTTSP